MVQVEPSKGVGSLHHRDWPHWGLEYTNLKIGQGADKRFGEEEIKELR
jgi:hypothetical protein